MFALAALATCLLFPAEGEGSLEGFLEHARLERVAIHRELRAGLDSIVARLETPSAPTESNLYQIQQDIDRLGREAAPLLIPLLEPGPADEEGKLSESAVRRANQVTLALIRLRPEGMLPALVSATQSGTEAGQVNAVRALGGLPEKERAAQFLAELHGRSSGPVRLACVVALSHLGGELSEPILRAALTDGNPEVIRSVLSALTKAHNLAAAPGVLNLMRLPSVAAPVGQEILNYWLAQRELVDEPVIDALVAMTLRTDMGTLVRVNILKSFPKFELAQQRSFRNKLDPALQSADVLVQQAAMVCAAALGDRTSRKNLLRPFDETIEGNRNWWKAHQERGIVLLEIQDYSAGAKDLQRAIDLLGTRAHDVVHQDMWVALARCHVLGNKLSRARDTLVEMQMRPTLKEALRDDPDFAPLRDHSTYGSVFD